MTEEDIAVMRARDFWGALVLMAASGFFLWRTFDIPLKLTSVHVVRTSV